MKIRTLVTIVCCLAAVGRFHAATDRELAASFAYRPIAEIKPQLLSEDERMKAIEVMKKEFPHDVVRLIRLHDEASIKAVIADWESSTGQTRRLRQQLERCASPWMLPKLAQFIYRDEPDKLRPPLHYEGLHDWGFSHVTALVMRQIILASPEIPEAAKAWCRVYVYPHDEDTKQVHEMRRWWEANRENLEKERYDLLVPLPANPSSVPAKPTSAALIDIPSGLAPTKQSSTPPPAMATGTTDTGDNPTTFWTWGIGAILVALAVVFIWRPSR